MSRPLRIALVTTYGPPHLGGIERIVDNLFHGYRRAGQEVRWVTSRVPASLPAAEGDVVRVPTWNVLEDRLGVPVPMWGRAGLRALREAVAWADAVHVVEALYLTSAMAAWVARRAGRPLLLSQNVGLIPYRSRPVAAAQRLAWATVGTWVLRSASQVVLATPTAEAFVRGLLGGPPAGEAVVPVGIDVRAFRPPTAAERAAARAALGLGPGPVVLFAGRLVEKKGLPIVLEVAARLPGAAVLVAGDGPERHRLEGAPPNVRHLGVVAPDAMPALYAAADAALLPSRGEGLPLLVQEAMAAGLPVVFSEDEPFAAGLAAAGVGFPARRDGAAMAGAVRAALAAPPEAVARARAHAEAHWALEAMVAAHLALLRGLVGAGAAVSGAAAP